MSKTAVLEEKKVAEFRVLEGQVLVEVDLEVLGEVERTTDGGLVIPEGDGKGSGPEALTGIVVCSAVPGLKIGETVYFDRVDGFRFDYEGMALMSLYAEHIRAIV